MPEPDKVPGPVTKPGDNPKYDRLVELLAEVVNLRQIGALAYWDQQVMMPKAGASARGSHLAAVQKVAHEKFTTPELGRLFEELRGYEASLPYDSDEASTIRVGRREYEKATRIPADLVARLARAQTTAYTAWLEARERKEYAPFLPALRVIYELSREVAEVIGYKEHPLDALVDQSEPGMTAAEVDSLLESLRARLVPLCQAIFARVDTVDDTILRGHFATEPQMALGREVAQAIGFDLNERGRLDLSVHPFTTSFAPTDARITTKVDEAYLATSLWASIHEAGHGTYEQGIPERFQSSILGSGASGGLHESQSLLWENVVGRSLGFCQFILPRLRAHFPAEFGGGVGAKGGGRAGGATAETVYRAVNKVQPSFIRVDADEVTYSLHVIIRWELEKAVFDGKLALADLAEAWNRKYRDYLGITPPNDLVGVLQDIHWTGGFGAQFASYSIGHVACQQLYRKAKEDIPGLEDGFRRGEFAPLLHWMNENVHAWAAKLEPQELLKKVTGRPLDPGPYLEYIEGKFRGIYGL